MKFAISSVISALALLSVSVVDAGVAHKRAAPHTITVVNRCSFPIWPALFTSAGGQPSPSTTGWKQESGKSYTLTVPGNWNGRLWGRTNCDFSKSGLQNCDTGYCVGGLQCQNPGVPPVTLAEFNMCTSPQPPNPPTDNPQFISSTQVATPATVKLSINRNMSVTTTSCATNRSQRAAAARATTRTNTYVATGASSRPRRAAKLNYHIK
ncbi:thaumatin family-domain-containing protein [Jimgerdemannia flammicorona]|uniref:Thaumatin family-domain-containing protein n=1 Tax=Jimgerdemannia flammicorona TaxID=994334 RepID=A0A433Q3E3_9FUNG|nr:thaumatin family-domain-containing protein [Jimgerdemannia flammicorona]